MKIGIVDIGTNSIHIIYAKVEKGGHYKIIGRKKDMIQLGEQTLMTGVLPQKSLDKAFENLLEFKHEVKTKQIDKVSLVATSAMREAKNTQTFVKRVKQKLGFDLKIISGLEEAQLIAKAVQKSVVFPEKKVLVLDIGGGSSEFILAKQKKVIWLESLPLGSNRLKQKFPLSDPPQKKEIKNLEGFVFDVMALVFQKMNDEKTKTLIGTSGTLNSLARMIRKEYEFEANDLMPRKVILKFYKNLIAKTNNQRNEIPGLSKKRAPMIIQGLSIAKVLLENSALKYFWPCEAALREGLLFEAIEKANAE